MNLAEAAMRLSQGLAGARIVLWPSPTEGTHRSSALAN